MKISINKVKPATNLFPALKTFVAPIFLEPTLRISLLKKNLLKINPKGIDPHMYEKRDIKNISNITVC